MTYQNINAMIKPINTTYLTQCRVLYRTAVQHSGHQAYNAAQVTAWAAYADSDTFVDFIGTDTVGYFIDATLVGFAGIDAQGYIKSVYVAPTHQGQGIATRLVQHLVQSTPTLSMYTVAASKLSRPLFEKLSFQVVETEYPQRNGVTLERYKMMWTRQC